MSYAREARMIGWLRLVVALLAVAAVALLALGDLVLACIVTLIALVVQRLVRDAAKRHAEAWWICSR